MSHFNSSPFTKAVSCHENRPISLSVPFAGGVPLFVCVRPRQSVQLTGCSVVQGVQTFSCKGFRCIEVKELSTFPDHGLRCRQTSLDSGQARVPFGFGHESDDDVAWLLPTEGVSAEYCVSSPLPTQFLPNGSNSAAGSRAKRGFRSAGMSC